MATAGKQPYTLDGIYDATQRGEALEYYKKNAKTYDEWCVVSGKDNGAMSVATIIEKHKPSKDSRILDVAAGTGIMGKKLRELGYHEIDALDPVQEMLDEAKAKGLYKNYFCEAIEAGKASQIIPENAYDVVCCLGAFGFGHLTPACLPELLRVATKGGIITFNIVHNERNWSDNPDLHEENVQKKLQSFVDERVCSEWTQQEITYYNSDEITSSDHKKQSKVYVLTKA